MASSSSSDEKGVAFKEHKIPKEDTFCEETSFSKRRTRSLWYRVPKSRVILKKNRGIPSGNLMRLATENSAKLHSPITLPKEATNSNIYISNSLLNQPLIQPSRSSIQG